MSPACPTCPVSQTAACAVLTLEEREAMAAAGRTRVLKRGEMLFAAGDEDAACATLLTGALKVSAVDIDGNEQILALVHPAGFIGELFAPFAHHDVVALTESRLCTFAKADIERAIEDYPAMARALLRRSQADLLATRNLLDVTLPDALFGLLTEFGVPPEALELEITESSLMNDPERALQVVNQIAAMGMKLSIDDFGTGYSSLAYLKRLPVHSLKIDRSFVRDMLLDEQDAIIVRSTIGLAHSLGLNVVAEGVEDLDTLARLRDYACDEAQGFVLSKPQPAPVAGVTMLKTPPGAEDWRTQ